MGMPVVTMEALRRQVRFAVGDLVSRAIAVSKSNSAAEVNLLREDVKYLERILDELMLRLSGVTTEPKQEEIRDGK